MEPVTVSLTEEQIDLLKELSGDDGPCKNRSDAAALRNRVGSGVSTDAIVDAVRETREER